MALLLIKATSATHLLATDPDKDARGCYKRGDIVDVYRDDQHDGDLVAHPIQPPFVLVRITDVTRAQAVRLMQPQTTDALVDGRVVRTVVRKRRHALELDNIPPGPIRNRIGNDRYIEVTWAQIRDYLRNKETGLTEGPTP